MKFKVDVNILSVEDVPGKAERVVVAVVRLSHTHTHTHTHLHTRAWPLNQERNSYMSYLCNGDRNASLRRHINCRTVLFCSMDGCRLEARKYE